MSEWDTPVLRALAAEAVAATGARSGCVVVIGEDGATIAAVAGAAEVAAGIEVSVEGSRGFALASGQPSAMVPGPADTAQRGIGGVAGLPTSLLVAPGGEGRVLLEVADKVGGGGFTFEDIEVLSSYASIAEAAMATASTGAGGGPPVASPARLGAELAALAASDGTRYREVANVVELLLGTDR